MPWLFEGTGARERIDDRRDASAATGSRSTRGRGPRRPARSSSPTIPNIFGPGINAEMTYYETAAGARVFNAGALDFGGSVLTWPVEPHAREPLGPHDRTTVLTRCRTPRAHAGCQAPVTARTRARRSA